MHYVVDAIPYSLNDFPLLLIIMGVSPLLDTATLEKRIVQWLGFSVDVETALEEARSLHNDAVRQVTVKVVDTEVRITDIEVDANKLVERRFRPVVASESSGSGKWMWHKDEYGLNEQVFIMNEKKVRLPSVCRNEKSMKDSMRRAYTNVVDKCVMLKGDRLLTLTFQENIESLDRANIAFKEFVRLCRKRWPGFAYVAVPEHQKRGCVHFHLVVNGFYLWSSLLAIWRKAVSKISDMKAGIDIRKKSVLNTSLRVAKYMAKYVFKDGGIADFNGKRYYASKNIPKIPKISFYVAADTYEYIRNNVYVEFISGITQKFIKKAVLKPFEAWHGGDAFIAIVNVSVGDLKERGRQGSCLIEKWQKKAYGSA